jgi:phage host-nuclease inhibitor protein Gam
MPDALTVPEKVTTTDELDDLLCTIGELKHQRDALDQKMERRIAKAREAYAGDIAELDLQIQSALTTIITFVRRKRRSLFGDESSVQLPHGILQIRQNPEKVSYDKDQEEAIIEQLVRAGLDHLIVEKISIDRNGLKRADVREQIQHIDGITITRAERLTVKPATLSKGLSETL